MKDPDNRANLTRELQLRNLHPMEMEWTHSFWLVRSIDERLQTLDANISLNWDDPLLMQIADCWHMTFYNLMIYDHLPEPDAQTYIEMHLQRTPTRDVELWSSEFMAPTRFARDRILAGDLDRIDEAALEATIQYAMQRPELFEPFDLSKLKSKTQNDWPDDSPPDL